MVGAGYRSRWLWGKVRASDALLKRFAQHRVDGSISAVYVVNSGCNGLNMGMRSFCSSIIRRQETFCLNVYENATLERKSYDLTNSKALGVTIHPRDFTTLDVEISGNATNRARRRRSYTLLPRNKFILINYGSIKALLVKNDKIVIFGAQESKMVKTWAYKVVERIPDFQECVESGVSVSFELGVLEETLKEACDMFDRRLRLLKPLVKNLVKSSSSEDFSGLLKLGPLEDALKVYEMEIREARKCVLDLLQSDEDMHSLVALHNSTIHSFQSMTMTKEHAATIASVELLLESYQHKMSRQLDTTNYFQQQLATWANIKTMTGEMKRNQILTYNLQMTIAAVSIGASGMVAGIFGMNLPSGLESGSTNLFYVVAGALITGTVSFQLASARYLLGSTLTKRYQREASNIEGMKALLIDDASRLDDVIKLTFDTLDGMNGEGTEGDARISEEDFANMFLASSSPSEREADSVRDKAVELFKLIDTDGDGTIDRTELAGKGAKRSG